MRGLQKIKVFNLTSATEKRKWRTR